MVIAAAVVIVPLGVLFFLSGLVVNFIQAISFVLVRPLSKSLYRRINRVVAELLWLELDAFQVLKYIQLGKDYEFTPKQNFYDGSGVAVALDVSRKVASSEPSRHRFEIGVLGTWTMSLPLFTTGSDPVEVDLLGRCYGGRKLHLIGQNRIFSPEILPFL